MSETKIETGDLVRVMVRDPMQKDWVRKMDTTIGKTMIAWQNLGSTGYGYDRIYLENGFVYSANSLKFESVTNKFKNKSYGSRK